MKIEDMQGVAAAAKSGGRIGERIGVIGLGYVGLPVAVAFARACDHVVGFDISETRIDGVAGGVDVTGEVAPDALAQSTLRATSDPADLEGCTFFVVTVPTPVNIERRPDTTALRKACETVGPYLSPGAIVVFESTVYPGMTEEFCGPVLEEASGLVAGRDFELAYSPERINPGDTERRLETIVKIVSAQTPAGLERVAAAYGEIIEAGLHLAASIKVAEAAKVIENTQRDINIALMNELSLIFDRLDIPTRDVLAAAGTKWNFLRFTPGLVGGHCIGIDPYYLTAKAEAVGYHPQVILSGRRINDDMGRFIAQKTVRLMVEAGIGLQDCRVGVLGMTFKENVPDLRNSKVIDVITELRLLGIEPMVADPLCDPAECKHEYGLNLSEDAELQDLDALILAVPHRAYLSDIAALAGRLRKGGVLIDVKSSLDRAEVPEGIRYWSL